MSLPIHDIVGIGFGPSNLALAIVLEEQGYSGSVVFLEKAARLGWYPGMMPPGSDIRNNPLRDLVTPRNPRSRYSFVNYLHETGRLFEFLNLPAHYPLRKDYAAYAAWAARQFDRLVRYEHAVTGLGVETAADGEPIWRVRIAGRPDILGRSLVVGPGRTPRIPEVFAPHLGEQVFHLVDYLPRLEARDEPRSLAVIGSSQSAVELLLDLSSRYPRARTLAIHRTFGFRLKDTNPFSDRVHLPEFVDRDVIDALYMRLYEDRLDGRERVTLIGSTAVCAVTRTAQGVTLDLECLDTGARRCETVDAVVLATGFRNFGTGEGQEPYPPVLADVADRFALDARGGLHVERDYALKARPGMVVPPVHLNGPCESTHGLGDAGSFSLLSVRSADLARGLLIRLAARPPRREAGITVLRKGEGAWRRHLGRLYKDAAPEGDRMPFGIALSQLAPGESSTRHAHAQREGFFIMAGEPELRLNDEALPLGPGDVVVVEPGHRHCLANPPGKPPVDYVCLWWHETPLPPAERA